MRSKLVAALIAAAISGTAHAQSDPVGVCKDPRGCTVSGGGNSTDGYPTIFGTRPLIDDLKGLFGGQEKREDAQPSPADLKQQQMVELQKQGLEKFRADDYSEALRLFELSLKMCVAADDIKNLKKNVGSAHSQLGVLAHKRGDLDQSLREFELADQYDPGQAVFTDSLTTIRNEIAARKLAVEEQNRRARELEEVATAARMRKKIEAFAATLDTAPPTVGLVVKKAGATGDYLLGTHRANPPPFAFGSPDDLEAASEQASQGFDDDRRLAGTKPVAGASNDPASQDPEMIAGETELAKLKADRLQLDAEIDKLTKERNAADAVKAQSLTLELNKKVETKATKLIEIYRKEEKNQKLRLTINTKVAGEGQK